MEFFLCFVLSSSSFLRYLPNIIFLFHFLFLSFYYIFLFFSCLPFISILFFLFSYFSFFIYSFILIPFYFLSYIILFVRYIEIYFGNSYNLHFTVVHIICLARTNVLF
jgi:hypothetical protein